MGDVKSAVQRLQTLLQKYKLEQPPLDRYEQVETYVNEAVNEAISASSHTNELLLSNVDNIEPLVQTALHPLIDDFANTVHTTIQQILAKVGASLSNEFINDSTSAYPDISHISAKCAFRNELKTVLVEFTLSSLLMKCVAANEAMIKFFDAIASEAILGKLDMLADEIEMQVLSGKNAVSSIAMGNQKIFHAIAPEKSEVFVASLSPKRADDDLDDALDCGKEAAPVPPPRSFVTKGPSAINDAIAPRIVHDTVTPACIDVKEIEVKNQTESTDPETAEPVTGRKNASLMQNLNRMLAGPPPTNLMKAEKYEAPSDPSLDHVSDKRPLPDTESQAIMKETPPDIPPHRYSHSSEAPPPVPRRSSEYHNSTVPSRGSLVNSEISSIAPSAPPREDIVLNDEGKIQDSHDNGERVGDKKDKDWKKKGIKAMFSFRQAGKKSKAEKDESKIQEHATSNTELKGLSPDTSPQKQHIDFNVDATPIFPLHDKLLHEEPDNVVMGNEKIEHVDRLKLPASSASMSAFANIMMSGSGRQESIISDDVSKPIKSIELVVDHQSPPNPTPRVKPPVPRRSVTSIEDHTLLITKTRNTADEHPVPTPRPRPPKPVPSPASRTSVGSIELGSPPFEHLETLVDPAIMEPVLEVAPPKRKIPGLVAIPGMPGLPMGGLAPKLRPKPVPREQSTEQAEPLVQSTEAIVNMRSPRPPVPVKPKAPVQSTVSESSSVAPIPEPEESLHYVSPHGSPLQIKKVIGSVSGDDKAIEKNAIDWLNHHLASQDTKVDNLFSSLKDGLYLIYALEDATGDSVGKYNKKAMLPVHKVDNIAVALNFLSKKGVSTQFLTPQDVFNEDRGKILALFNFICKKYPIEKS